MTGPSELMLLYVSGIDAADAAQLCKLFLLPFVVNQHKLMLFIINDISSDASHRFKLSLLPFVAN